MPTPVRAPFALCLAYLDVTHSFQFACPVLGKRVGVLEPMRLGEMRMLVPLPDEVFQVKASSDPRRGQGLFTARDLDAGTFLFDYEGEVILEKSAEGVRRTLLSDYSVGVVNTAGVSFIVDAMDPERSNLARYMNHSPSTSHKCNCELREQDATSANAEYAAVIRERLASEKAAGREGPDMQALVTELLENPEAIPPPRLHLFTTRAVPAGEELLFDYGDLYWESMKARGRGEALV